MKKSYLFLLFVSLLQFAVRSINAQPLNNGEKLAKAMEIDQTQVSYYNIACYFSLNGRKKLAFSYLKKAINTGFSDLKLLMQDEDLVILHNEKEWSLLVEDLKSKETLAKSSYFNTPTFWESHFFHTSYDENISEDEKVAGLSKFWSELKYNFVNFDLIPDIDIDSLYFQYLPKVKTTRSTLEYYKMLTEMCAKLRDGHTNVFPPAELRNRVYAKPLINTRLIEDKVLIVKISSDLLKQGLKPGLEILSVNNIPVKEYAIKYVKPFESASTVQDMNARMFEYALLAGDINEPILLKLKDEDEKVFTRTIYRVTPQRRSEDFKTPTFEYKTLDGNIKYLAINSFSNDSSSRFFNENYSDISQGKALIIDLRNNGGGNSYWDILRYLIDSVTLVHTMYTPEYRPAFRAWGMGQSLWKNEDRIAPQEYRYSKPVVLLVSPKTYSAAEDFTAAFKSLNCGIIIGEPTGGSTGQPLNIQLPGGISARICTKRDQFSDQTDFVGKGILPDIMAKPTVKDMRNNIDTGLDVALKFLKQQKGIKF